LWHAGSFPHSLPARRRGAETKLTPAPEVGGGPGRSPEARREVVPVVEAEDGGVTAAGNPVVASAGSGGVEASFP